MSFLARFLNGRRDLSQLRELAERVAQLEARELAHDIAWSESKEQISRHLKRVSEIERRSKSDNPMSAVQHQLLELKLRKREA